MAASYSYPYGTHLEVVVVSAKHLKNVNWRNGDLKPYAVAYIDQNNSDLKSTRPDDCGSTSPVWNDLLMLPFHTVSSDAVLTVEVLHRAILPCGCERLRPLVVGTASVLVKDLINPLDALGSATPAPCTTLELRRPSGRPQGKIRIRVAVRESTPATFTPTLVKPFLMHSKPGQFSGSPPRPGWPSALFPRPVGVRRVDYHDDHIDQLKRHYGSLTWQGHWMDRYQEPTATATATARPKEESENA